VFLPRTPANRQGHNASRLVARRRLPVAPREAGGLAARESRPGEFLAVNSNPEEACGASRSKLFGRGFDSRRLHQSDRCGSSPRDEPAGRCLAGSGFWAACGEMFGTDPNEEGQGFGLRGPSDSRTEQSRRSAGSPFSADFGTGPLKNQEQRADPEPSLKCLLPGADHAA